jgi:hypothetical protein
LADGGRLDPDLHAEPPQDVGDVGGLLGHEELSPVWRFAPAATSARTSESRDVSPARDAALVLDGPTGSNLTGLVMRVATASIALSSGFASSPTGGVGCRTKEIAGAPFSRA